MDEKNKGKSLRWLKCTLAALAAVLVLYAAITAYIDPFFHYHAPLARFQYPIEDQRYQNDGILRNFEYEGVIIGSSITGQFKTSEAERLFGVPFVKTSFSGASMEELNDRLSSAFKSDNDIKYVVRCIDTDLLLMADGMVSVQNANGSGNTAKASELNLPEYLYNDCILDDVQYVFNKEAFARTLRVLEYTRNGGKTPSFDDIRLSYDDNTPSGAEVVLSCYTPPAHPAEMETHLTEEERQTLLCRIDSSIAALVREHPETEFDLFFPPYSICYWDTKNGEGGISRLQEAQRVAIEALLQYDNVRLFGMDWDFETVCNLDLYYDRLHYVPAVCTNILECMSEGRFLITADNYERYLSEMSTFYHSYDYASLHAQKG